MAMYTKMTSTGSSLITNPRTISKDLESKIATSIASVIAKHDSSTLTTRVVRQAVEKDVHVSLTNHKELLKRLMHQEFRKLKTAKVAKRVVPETWKIAARRDAMRKGLNRVFAMLRDDRALFEQFGLHAIATLYELQRVAIGDAQRRATLFARLLGALWLERSAPVHGVAWVLGGETELTPALVVATLRAVFVVERLGLSHPQRVEFLELFDRAEPAFTAEAYFGWDPAVGPPVTDATGSAYAKMANALLGAYMAHCVGVSLGTSVVQLMELVPSLYPLQAPAELSATEYRDQALLVTTVVAVVTKFGTLRCEPELLPHEFFWLRHHVVHPLSRHDIVLVADELRALKCFDGAESLAVVRRGLAFLLSTQQPDGAWATNVAVEPDATHTLFATLHSVVALSDLQVVGFAPSVPELAPVLARHVNDVLSIQLEQHAAAATQTVAVDTSAAVSATAAVSTTAPMDTGAAHDDLATQVLFLQGMLEKNGATVKCASAALATHVVSTLADLPLTVEILKTTGVGRVINKLRKHAAADVAASATALVAKWKRDLL